MSLANFGGCVCNECTNGASFVLIPKDCRTDEINTDGIAYTFTCMEAFSFDPQKSYTDIPCGGGKWNKGKRRLDDQFMNITMTKDFGIYTGVPLLLGALGQLTTTADGSNFNHCATDTNESCIGKYVGVLHTDCGCAHIIDNIIMDAFSLNIADTGVFNNGNTGFIGDYPSFVQDASTLDPIYQPQAVIDEPYFSTADIELYCADTIAELEDVSLLDPFCTQNFDLQVDRGIIEEPCVTTGKFKKERKLGTIGYSGTFLTKFTCESKWQQLAGASDPCGGENTVALRLIIKDCCNLVNGLPPLLDICLPAVQVDSIAQNWGTGTETLTDTISFSGALSEEDYNMKICQLNDLDGTNYTIQP